MDTESKLNIGQPILKDGVELGRIEEIEKAETGQIISVQVAWNEEGKRQFREMVNEKMLDIWRTGRASIP